MLTSLSAERFVALDVHKHYVVVGAVTLNNKLSLLLAGWIWTIYPTGVSAISAQQTP